MPLRPPAPLRAPLLASAALLAASPFLGRLRDLLLDLFPARFVHALAAGFALAVLLLLAAAAARIRERRARRFGGLALAALLVALQAWIFATGDARVDAVERVHLLFYGGIAVLWYRGLGALPRWAGGAALAASFLSTAAVGLLDEWLQWLLPRRIGDVRDVLLNLGAAATGLVFAASLWPHQAAPAGAPESRPGRLLALAAAATLLLFGVFFHLAHLGYEIADPEIGRFRSYFTAARLEELRAARAAQWQREPPGPLPLLGVEDFFRTEAGWHVQHRNAALARGDARAAWKENQILEKYYDPFLDLPPLSGTGSHRLNEEERAPLERRRRRFARLPYESPALRERVFVRPTKPVFWLLVGGAAGALAVAAVARRR